MAGNDLKSPLLDTSAGNQTAKPFKPIFESDSPNINITTNNEERCGEDSRSNSNSIESSMMDTSWQNVSPFNLVTITKKTNNIIWFAMWSTWCFAIFWTIAEPNLITVSMDKIPTLLNSSNININNSRCNYFSNDNKINSTNRFINLYHDAREFKKKQAYIDLKAKFEFYNDSRKSSRDEAEEFLESLTDFDENGRYTFNMTVYLNVSHAGSDLPKDVLASYCKTETVTIECRVDTTWHSSNEYGAAIICDEFVVWDPHEDAAWSSEYPTSWEYYLFPGIKNYFTFNTFVDVDTPHNVKIKEYGNPVFIYTYQNFVYVCFDSGIRFLSVLITVGLLIFWCHRLLAFRV